MESEFWLVGGPRRAWRLCVSARVGTSTMDFFHRVDHPGHRVPCLYVVVEGGDSKTKPPRFEQRGVLLGGDRQGAQYPAAFASAWDQHDRGMATHAYVADFDHALVRATSRPGVVGASIGCAD